MPRRRAAEDWVSTPWGARQSASSKSITSVPKPSMATRTRRPPFSAASPHVRSPMAEEMTRPPWWSTWLPATSRRPGAEANAKEPRSATGANRTAASALPSAPSSGFPPASPPAPSPADPVTGNTSANRSRRCANMRSASASHLSATALIAVLLQLVHPPVVGKDAVALLLHVRQLRVHIGGKPHPLQSRRSVQRPMPLRAAGVSVAP